MPHFACPVQEVPVYKELIPSYLFCRYQSNTDVCIENACGSNVRYFVLEMFNFFQCSYFRKYNDDNKAIVLI